MDTNESDKDLNDAPGGSALSRAYRAAATEAPPPAVDAAILAEARRAVDATPRRARTFSRFAIPLSLAAALALAIGVVLHMTPDEMPDRNVSISEAAPATASPAEPAPAAPSQKSVESTRRAAPVAPVPQVHKLEESPVPDSMSASHRADVSDNKASSERSFAATSAPAARAVKADVTAVRVSGAPGAYEFKVTVRSPDTGCAQYADWWEIISVDGQLLYRRVLLHSHTDEQPFERSGGPVPIQADTIVWVRAHMNLGGYGGTAFKGSPSAGFVRAALAADFAGALAKQAPLPDGCAF